MNLAKNILIVGGTLLLARYVYKKYLSKMPEAKMIEGEVDACEEMAMTMRMSDEAKAEWIANCIDNPETPAPPSHLSPDQKQIDIIKAQNDIVKY
jgi:hypothetical protein